MFSINSLLKKSYYPWIVWGLAASAFLVEYFSRVAPSVMMDELMRDLHTQALALGGLSAFFYYAYISMQIPVGMLADRFNPRWLLSSMVILCAFGCFLFACAKDVQTAAIARFVMGFGAAFAFVTALKIASLWFPPSQLGLLAGLTQALGMFGASVGQAPMAVLVKHCGWRETMLIICVLLIIIAAGIALCVRNKNKMHAVFTPVLKNKEVLKGLITVLKNPQSWLNGLFVGLLYAPTAALAELWGVKFFRQTYLLTNAVAAIGIGLIFLGWTIGGPLLGYISDRCQKRKSIMIFSAIFSFIFLTLALYIPHLPISVLFSFLFLYGIANTGVATSYALAGEINTAPLSGMSMAFANMSSIVIGAAFQPLIGWLLEKKWDHLIENGIPVYSAQNFRGALIILPVCLASAVAISCFLRETHGRVKE